MVNKTLRTSEETCRMLLLVARQISKLTRVDTKICLLEVVQNVARDKEPND